MSSNLTPSAIRTSMMRFLPLLIMLGSALVLPAFGAKKTPTQPPPVDAAADSAPEAEADARTDRAAAKTPGKITGTYSTLRSLGGDDEMIGIEVIIVRSREGLRAFVQTADGVPGTPVLVPVSLDGQTLSFTVPSTTGEPLQFKGKATRQGLSGTLDDRPLTLPRRRSYWQ